MEMKKTKVIKEMKRMKNIRGYERERERETKET